jgi:hypothetical protein
MAKITLPTNYRDDILNSSAEGKRKYVMSYNQDGTVSFEDVTPYEQVGSDFGAGDINTANEAINQSFDKNKLVKDLDTINALTKEGFAPDALAVKQLNENLGGLRFGVDGEGNYGYFGADDSLIPFSSGSMLACVYGMAYNTSRTCTVYKFNENLASVLNNIITMKSKGNFEGIFTITNQDYCFVEVYINNQLVKSICATECTNIDGNYAHGSFSISANANDTIDIRSKSTVGGSCYLNAFLT